MVSFSGKIHLMIALTQSGQILIVEQLTNYLLSLAGAWRTVHHSTDPPGGQVAPKMTDALA